MHIGLILPSYDIDDPSGIPALSTFVKGLAGFADLTIFPTRLPGGPQRWSQQGVGIVAAGGPAVRVRELVREVLGAIRAEHHRYPFDVIHGYWLFEPGLIAVLAGQLLRVPAVTSIGGAEPAALPEIGYGGMLARRGRLLHRGILRASTLVTGGSGYVLDLARQAAGPEGAPVRLAPLPVDMLAFGEVPGSSDRVPGPPALLHVAAYLPVKGQDLSIRALSRVHERVPNAQLLMIGENPRGYRQRMEQLASALGVDDAVQFVERIPHTELGRHYAAADLLVMPSRHESQGMVVLEAGCFGLAAAGSGVGVVADLSPDASLAVPAGDSTALADTIVALLGDDALRRALGENARKAVQERYAVEPVIQRWMAIYAEALERG
jgi:glycosyltransferase involved in cell wall biosynthesis